MCKLDTVAKGFSKRVVVYKRFILRSMRGGVLSNCPIIDMLSCTSLEALLPGVGGRVGAGP